MPQKVFVNLASPLSDVDFIYATEAARLAAGPFPAAAAHARAYVAATNAYYQLTDPAAREWAGGHKYYSTKDGVDIDLPGLAGAEFTTTFTGNRPAIYSRVAVNCVPTSDSQAIFTALTGRVDWNSASNLTGNGHLIGVIGHVKNSGAGTVAFAVPVEARVDQFGAGGAITLACNMLVTTGNVVGSVAQYRGIYAPDMSGLSGFNNFAPGNRYLYYSGTPSMGLYNAGDIITASRYIVASTTAALAQVVAEWQQPNAVNSGVRLLFSIGAGVPNGTGMGSLDHELLSGSASRIKLNVFSGGTAHQPALQLEGNAGTGQANIGINGASYGGGKGVLFLASAAVAPASAITGGIALITDGTVLKFMTTGGVLKTVLTTP